MAGGKKNQPIVVAQIMGKWVGGGVEAVIMNYYRHIDRNKVQFDFICDEDSTNIPYEEIEKLGGHVILCPPYQKLFKYMKFLENLFREKKYRIVHSNINTLSVFPLRAAKKAGVKVRIAHSHSVIKSSKAEPMRSAFKLLLRKCSKKNATLYFACSKEAGVSQFGRRAFKNNEVRVINNVIEPKEYKYCQRWRQEIRKKYNIKTDDIVFGMVGRMVTTKNPTYAVERFAEYYGHHKNAVFLFVGDGPELKKIKKIACKGGYENRLIFAGQVTDVSPFYSAMDILLFPSLYEGFGMALVEAQYSGLPCVASSIVPRTTKITDRVRYLDVRSSRAWDETIKSYLETITEKVRRKNAINIKGYDVATEVEKLEKVYKSFCYECGN